MNKTYSAKPSEITRSWHLVDAKGKTLGRLSTKIAKVMQGKQKPSYTPHIDGGDFVVVINAAEVSVSGNKLDEKIYYRHSGYPGGIKEVRLKELLEKDATKVIEHSVRGMLPKNKLLDGRLQRLKVYEGSEHPHEAQQPKELEV